MNKISIICNVHEDRDVEYFQKKYYGQVNNQVTRHAIMADMIDLQRQGLFLLDNNKYKKQIELLSLVLKSMKESNIYCDYMATTRENNEINLSNEISLAAEYIEKSTKELLSGAQICKSAVKSILINKPIEYITIRLEIKK